MLEVFDENHLSEMIKDSVTQLCKNVFHYNLELTVDGLLGVTLDKSSVMLISIKENVQVATLNQDLQLNSQDMATDSGTAVTGKKANRRNRKAAKTYRSESTYVESEEEQSDHTKLQQQNHLEAVNTLGVSDRGEQVQIDECDIIEPQEAEEMGKNLEYGEEEEKTCLVYDSAPILVHESPDENDEGEIPETKRPIKQRKRSDAGDDLSSVAEMYHLYTMLTDAINGDNHERSTRKILSFEENPSSHEDEVDDQDSEKKMSDDICKDLKEKAIEQNDGAATVDVTPLDLSLKATANKVTWNNTKKRHGNTAHDMTYKENITGMNKFGFGSSCTNADARQCLDEDTGPLPCKAQYDGLGMTVEQDTNNNCVTTKQTKKNQPETNTSTKICPDPQFSLNHNLLGKEAETYGEKLSTFSPDEDDNNTQILRDMPTQASEQLVADKCEINGMVSSEEVMFSVNGFQTPAIDTNAAFCKMDENGDVISGIRNNGKFINGLVDFNSSEPVVTRQNGVWYRLKDQDNPYLGVSDNTRLPEECRRMFENCGIHDQSGFYRTHEPGNIIGDMIDTGQNTNHKTDRSVGNSIKKELHSQELSENTEGSSENGKISDQGSHGVAWHRPVCYELLEPHGERKPKKGTFHYVVQETIRAACMEFLGQSPADRALDLDRRHRNNIVEAVCERLMTRFPELRTESRISRILNCKIRKCISNKLYYYRRNPQEKFDGLESG